jgi:hypothetical protein
MKQLNHLATLLTALSLSVGCDNSSTETAYVRADDTSAIRTSWQNTMTAYRGTYQNESEVVSSLGLDAATRTVTDAEFNRFQYTTNDGIVDVWYDAGILQPYHGVQYQRSSALQEQTWTSSSELKQKWETGARVAAAYISQLTTLTPVVWVVAGTDTEYADALINGYEFWLTIDGWPLWVDDLHVTVDAKGIYDFHTNELAYDATESGSIDCRSQAEVDALLEAASLAAVDLGPALSPPIFYGFDKETLALTPFLLAADTTGDSEAGLAAVPLDRTITEF